MLRRMIPKGIEKAQDNSLRSNVNTEAADAIDEGIHQLFLRFGATYYLLPIDKITSIKNNEMIDGQGSSKLTKKIIKENISGMFEAVIYPVSSKTDSGTILKQSLMYTSSKYINDNKLNIKFTEQFYIGDLVGLSYGHSGVVSTSLDEYYGAIYQMKYSKNYHVNQPSELGGIYTVSCWELTEVK